MSTATTTRSPVTDMTPALSRTIATTNPATPATLLQMAVEQGADLDRLERLMALQERWEANEAKKAFTAAMAEFKAHPPEITKDKLVSFTGTSYMHATLGNVCEKIVAALARVGISHKWDLNQESGQVAVTCVLTHRLGYSDSTRMESGADTSGKKNSIQAIASTITYLQRYTLLAATGLATQDQDDDAAHEDEAQTPAWVVAFLDRIEASSDADELKKIWEEAMPTCHGTQDKRAHACIKAAVIARQASLPVVAA